MGSPLTQSRQPDMRSCQKWSHERCVHPLQDFFSEQLEVAIMGMTFLPIVANLYIEEIDNKEV